jgi:hypothetical protein
MPYGGWRELVEIGVHTRPWRRPMDYSDLLPEVWDARVAASTFRSDAALPFTVRV